MSIEFRLFLSKKGNGSFLWDVDQALADAAANQDAKGERIIQELWPEHWEETLGSKSRERMERYLKDRLWRKEGQRPLYRTAGPPCLAYTVFYLEDGTLVVTALALTYAYPKGGETGWLSSVIRPRLAEL